MQQNTTAIRQVLDEILAAFNAHDLDRIMGFFAEDCVLEMPRGPHPWGDRYEGLAAVRAGLASRFAGMPDVSYDEAEHFVSGDTGISQWTLRGTPASGPPIEVRGCDFYSFRNGRITRKNSFWKRRD